MAAVCRSIPPGIGRSVFSARVDDEPLVVSGVAGVLYCNPGADVSDAGGQKKIAFRSSRRAGSVRYAHSLGFGLFRGPGHDQRNALAAKRPTRLEQAAEIGELSPHQRPPCRSFEIYSPL